MIKSRIEKYLLEKTNKIVFISISEKKLDKIELLNEYKEIDFPIFSEVVLELASNEKEGINVKDIVSAMLYMQGIDSNFKYSKMYKNIIEKITKNPLLAASNLAGDAYEKKLFLDSLIFSRGYNNSFKPDKNLMFNYALLCQEISDQAIDEEKKADFLLESENSFTEIISLFPDFGKAYYYLGYYRLRNNDLENAKIFFEKSIEFGIDLEFEEDAKDNLHRILVADKLSLAIEDLEMQDYASAKQILNEVLNYDKTSYEANFYLGYIYRLQGEYELAIDHYEIAFKANSLEPNLINEMALCFAFLGDFDQSLELLEHAYHLEPNSIEILCNLAMIHFNMDELDEAKLYIKKAEDIDSLDDIVQGCIKVIYNEEL